MKAYELSSILTHLPHKLRGLIARHVLRDVINSTPLLSENSFDMTFLVEVASRAHSVRVFAAPEGEPRTVLYEGGTIEGTMYIIFRGTAVVVHPLLNLDVLPLSAGDFCGTDAAVAFLEVRERLTVMLLSQLILSFMFLSFIFLLLMLLSLIFLSLVFLLLMNLR